MVSPIKSIMLKHPREAFVSQTYLEEVWQEFGYSSCPDFDKAIEEYAFFVSLLQRFVPEILFQVGEKPIGPDAIYTHDALKMTLKGAVLMNMGKPQRSLEPAHAKSFLERNGIPILGEIKPPGIMEGGDIVWLDNRTVALGKGFRTNQAGIDQFRSLTKGFNHTVIEVPLPYAGGPDQCLHLMSLISMLDNDLALVYSRYLPVFFREQLQSMGITLIEVAEEEYETLGGNVLTVAPKICIALDGNPKTAIKLRDAGVALYTYPGQEISLTGTGGPTCLTCPILR
jgi:N-dimethylarginine dimethylaminohydrolase